MFNGVSTSALSNWYLQVGAGSLTTSGYSGGSLAAQSTSVSGTGATNTTYFIIASSLTSATDTYSGKVELMNFSGNTWVSAGLLVAANGVRSTTSSGTITLSGALDRVFITSVNSVDTFDAGSINLLWEG
jgi:hypothetical protein